MIARLAIGSLFVVCCARGATEFADASDACSQMSSIAGYRLCKSGLCVMKAKLQGFYWKKAGGVSLDELAAELKKIAHKEQEYADYKRLAYIDKVGGFYVGVFLTSKDQRKAPTVQESDGRMVVRVTELGDPIIDFNFFVICEETCRGLYQHYHHSAGIGQFTGFCKQFHDQLRNTKRDAAIEAAGPKATKKELAEVRRPYRNTLKHGYLMRSDELQSLLKQMERIRDFQFEYMEVKPGDSAFAPLEAVSRKKVHRFVFSKDAKTAIINAITGAVETLDLTQGIIRASPPNGGTETIRILENPTNYGEFDVDDITTNETLDVSDIKASWFLKKMLKIAKQTPQITMP